MPGREEHAVGGFIVGAVASFLVQKSQGGEPNLGRAVSFGILGAAAAVMPDVLEPAVSPRHRSFAHSAGAGSCIMLAAKNAWDNPIIANEKKELAVVLASGFLSHLIADADTTAGIPLIGE